MRTGGVTPKAGLKPGITRSLFGALFGGDQGGLAGDALPSLVVLDPSIGETFAMHVGFAFFDALDAEDADDDSRIAIDLHVNLFVDGLRRFVVRVLNAGEEFAF